MTYYQKNRARLLDLARKYRETNRAEINRKQRERYATDDKYRQYAEFSRLSAPTAGYASQKGKYERDRKTLCGCR